MIRGRSTIPKVSTCAEKTMRATSLNRLPANTVALVAIVLLAAGCASTSRPLQINPSETPTEASTEASTSIFPNGRSTSTVTTVPFPFPVTTVPFPDPVTTAFPRPATSTLTQFPASTSTTTTSFPPPATSVPSLPSCSSGAPTTPYFINGCIDDNGVVHPPGG